jgi:hypothetical protein
VPTALKVSGLDENAQSQQLDGDLPMAQSPEAECVRIYEQWHEYTKASRADKLIDLYADDALLETPLVKVILDDKVDGILRGPELRSSTSSMKGYVGVPTIFFAGIEQVSSSLTEKWLPGNIRVRHRAATKIDLGRLLINPAGRTRLAECPLHSDSDRFVQRRGMSAKDQ